MRPGDLITVEGTTGTVENIGLRSTRIRTPARTVVTIPNGKLADSKIENLAPRERLQLTFSFGVKYDTSAAQLTSIMEALRTFILARDDSFKDGVFVHLRELGDSALVIEVNCWFLLAEGVDFRDVKQSVLLEALAIVERHGTALAYPTQQLIVSQQKTA
jgi:MscS family membrane protein